MKYIVMCAGNGKRWNNYLGIPKHFVKINGETLIGRTTRLLKEHNLDYIITTSDKRYKQYGETRPQTYNDCEVDRFEDIDEDEICYLYGDVYYTEDTFNTIINTDTEGILFFGSEMEIFAIKIKNKPLFMKHKAKVKKLYLENNLSRCIGWEVYKSLNNLPLEEYAITDRFYLITDETDDIDTPRNYLDFVYNIEGGNFMIKCEVINKDFTLARFDELKNIKRKSKEEKGKLFIGDIFECSKDIYNYLNGNNKDGIVVVKLVEVVPDVTVPKIENVEEALERVKESAEQEADLLEDPYKNYDVEKPIKKTTKKKTSKK